MSMSCSFVRNNSYLPRGIDIDFHSKTLQFVPSATMIIFGRFNDFRVVSNNMDFINDSRTITA